MRLLERARRIPWRDFVTALSILVLAALVIYVLVSTAASNDRIRQQYQSLTATYADLYEEAVVAGADPSAPPPEDVPEPDDGAAQLPIPGPSGAPGPTGETGPGPTQAQVVQALSTFCAVNDCTPTPTVAQVAAAISDFCTDGSCRGEDGADGKDGADGAAGRPPTSEEVATAVAAYCADGSCRGADGAKGDKGDKGDSAPPLTNDQILAQVNEYCLAHNGCQGDPGEPGPTCPDGYVAVHLEVQTRDDGVLVPAWTPAILCRKA